MIIIQLAIRNIIGAGLRTWLNVGILSCTYVLIIWHQGFFLGMQRQASQDMIKDDIAGGQFWCKGFDQLDPLSIEDSHKKIPQLLESLILQKKATPILIRQATIYPKGRMQSVLIKGIDTRQTIIEIPSHKLSLTSDILSIMVGKTMAKKNSFQIGDELTIRWRDTHGTFDAIEGRITSIMQTNVPTIDRGQLWVPLDRLQKMYDLDGEATLIIVDKNLKETPNVEEWIFKDHEFLLKDLNDMIKSKRFGSAVMYIILLFLAMLAIFDTQILSIFRRKKEIGTIMALGLTRLRVIFLFTLEGMMHGFLAVIAAALYGIPLLYFTAQKGIPLPGSGDYGFALTARLFPEYSLWLVMGTIIIIMVTVTIVSFLPSRRIAHLKPTDALRGNA